MDGLAGSNAIITVDAGFEIDYQSVRRMHHLLQDLHAIEPLRVSHKRRGFALPLPNRLLDLRQERGMLMQERLKVLAQHLRHLDLR
jgi:hypothetical protein